MGLVPDNTPGKKLNHQQFGGVLGILGGQPEQKPQEQGQGDGGVGAAASTAGGVVDAISGLAELAAL